jgi:multidrug efflux pump subunit AcrB
MNLTRAAIEKNRITFTALLVILLAGITTFRNMPRAEDPGFIIRTAMVRTIFPGASPERVEQLITDKIEKVVQEIPELDYVQSQSKTGVSTVYVNIKESYTHMRPIWDNLRRKIDKVTPDLPEGIIGPIVDDEFGDVFGTIVTITGDGYSYVELKEVADEVRDELLLIEEVAKVDIHGAQEERIFVEYNNARLAELGISAVQLTRILAERNIIIPGGSLRTGKERVVLEPSGNYETVEDIRRSIVQLPGRQEVIYLQDIASVRRAYVDPPSSRLLVNGEPALALAISMREGGNIIDLGARVSELMSYLQQVYPIGVEFDYVAFQAQVVDEKVRDFTASLMQAVGIVLLVMLLALGLRTGLVVASLIPMAMIMSLFVMGFLGIGLDQMSLASLIIALGMLVDNAIVMAESIMVRMQRGEEAKAAAIKSASELRVPLLVSSLTTAAAFLPIFLAESSTGEYTAPLFKVVTITLLCSWVLALTMIPMFCVVFLRVKPRGSAPFGTRLYRSYRGGLLAALRRPYLSLGVAIAVFFIALQGFRFIPAIFFPDDIKPVFTAQLDMPIGTAFERMQEVMAEIDGFVRDELQVTPERPEGVTSWMTMVGEGGVRFVLVHTPEPPGPEIAFMLVNASSQQAAEDAVARLDEFCFENFPDLKAVIKPLALGPPVGAPVQVRLWSRDDDVLFTLVEELKSKLTATPGTRSISDDWGPRTKKLVIDIDQARARRSGVTNQDIALSLQTNLSGYQSSEYREDDEVIPIVLRSVAADRQDIGKLESLNVYAQATGQSVPLKQVADARLAWEPAKIFRRNRLRTVTVESYLVHGLTATEVIGELEPWLDERAADWPVGTDYEFGGEIETSGKANQSINEKLPIAGLIIVLLLIGQFNSLRRAFIVLVTIPMGIIGVVIGLLVAQSYFGFMTLLGIISLAGIVINNAIVLIDRIRIEITEHGLDPPRAVVTAAQHRLRPILLTTCTTIGGLLPLWFGSGPMWEPMAIAIIFGLMFATMLTLGLVPILYSLLFRVSFKGFDYEAGAERS